MAKMYNLSTYNLVPNRKIGKWTLSTRIGKGGNGEVWKCRDENKEQYAIKFLKWGRGLPYKRFLDEVKFMEQYNQLPGIMPVVDKNLPSFYSQNYDRTLPFYYVMPLADSINWDKIKATFDDRILIIQELLNMLCVLHDNEIAHRDIKPQNILKYNGKYVLSDFGLVFFKKKLAKTPPNNKIGAKWTISPQMERDALSADKFKADVYSMAKTIWMILTGDMLGFQGQYMLNKSMTLRERITTNRYLYPLDRLLLQCTDYDELLRPTARELKEKFDEWAYLSNNWGKTNFLQWVEIQDNLFPSIHPTYAEWRTREDIIYVLKLLCKYRNLNHMFFPDSGGLDLTDVTISHEDNCLELICNGAIYVVKPTRLFFEFINSEYEWNYFILETGPLEPHSENLHNDAYFEELAELSPLDYRSLSEISKIQQDKPGMSWRHIVRYLHGTFLFFHKDSIYNQLICQYDGGHERYGFTDFRLFIEELAKKFKGATMEKLRSMNNS